MIPTGLKRSLREKLWLGCTNSVNIIQENTPIDAQRLHDSIAVTNAVETDDGIIKCRITIGGQELYGVRKERDIKRPVNYAKIIESRYGFVRQSLADIHSTIMNELNSK